MPLVDTKHEQYHQRSAQWMRCRDALAGEDAIKAKGSDYLPQLGGMAADDYAGYKKRAMWYGASARTLQGLSGSVFRKPPVVQVPPLAEPWLADVGLNGTPAEVYARKVFDEVMAVGRVGCMVDFKTGAPYPSLLYYTAEEIINWKTDIVNGEEKLVRVVLQETITQPDPNDEFVDEEINQWRVLELIDGVMYQQRVFQQQGDGKVDEFVLIKTVVPTKLDEALDYIPFKFIGPTTLVPTPEKPPLLDLVDVNLSHYRSSADLEHGAHFTGLPTPWAAGFPMDTELKIGSGSAWLTDKADGRVGMLEFTGQGLGALENRLEKKEQLMAVLGARLLEEQKRTAETAETVRMRQTGEQATLKGTINTVMWGLEEVIGWQVDWGGLDASDVQVTLNTDLVGSKASPEELTAIVNAVQSGNMSFETLYYNFEQLEMTEPGVTAEEERARIDEGQAGATQPDQPGNATDADVDPIIERLNGAIGA